MLWLQPGPGIIQTCDQIEETGQEKPKTGLLKYQDEGEKQSRTVKKQSLHM